MTTDYKQPDFYRFNQDSTKLISFILEQSQLRPEMILDLGAGSGVLGIEYGLKSPLKRIHFVELQKSFLPYIEENMKVLLPQIEFEITNKKFSEISIGKYDLIVSNPPYFHSGDGQISPIAERQTARSWEVDNLNILIQVIKNHLTENGEGWVSLPNDSKTIQILNSFQGIKIFPQTEKLNYVRILV